MNGREERLQIMLSPQELAIIDNFRFANRMPTRAAAVRELLKLGLASAGITPGDGSRSSNYGVFSRGPNSHTDGDDDPTPS
ncbi:MAG: hypothetical protein ACTHK9_12050 [Nitrobacter sp.]|jgi:hypothetical protein